MSKTRRTWTVISIAVAILVVVTEPGIAQYREQLEVRAVIAPVTVRTAMGRVVSDVEASKFHLFVDGIEVAVQDVAPEGNLPLSLGFVLDTSGSMGGRKIRACRELITAFLQERREDDQLALWTFGDDRVMARFPFETSWYLLPRVLESIKPWSTTALYDMVQRVPEVMERAEHPRRVVILLTDGVDNASQITYAQATEIAQGLKTPLYVLGVEPPPRPPGVEGPSYEDTLGLIADSSGGRYQRIPEVKAMPRAVRRLLKELSSRFIISFTTSGIGEARWRTIEVQVDGYEATTRKGYMGTLP